MSGSPMCDIPAALNKHILKLYPAPPVSIGQHIELMNIAVY